MKRFVVKEEEYKKNINDVKEILSKEENILFAYLHGSFSNLDNFGDIDIAVFLNHVPDNVLDIINLEFDLGKKIEKTTSFPTDVRVLNSAPPSFRYNVIKKGIKLLEKDEKKRVDFETITLKEYFDFLPFRKRYFREAMGREV